MIDVSSLKEITGFKIKDKIYTQQKSDIRKLLYAIGWTDADIDYAGIETETILWENITRESYDYALQMYTNGVTSFDFSNDTDLQILPHFTPAYNDVDFSGCSNLVYIPIYNIAPDTMKDCFSGCTKLKSCYLGNWDVYKVDDFSNCFYNSKGGLHLDGISNWNTANASTFAGMFEGGVFNNDIVLDNWNTGKVGDYSSMFKNCQMNSVSIKNFNFDGDDKWNQLIKNGNFINTSDWIPSSCNIDTDNNILTISITAAMDSGTVFLLTGSGASVDTHKYYLSFYYFIPETNSETVYRGQLRRANNNKKFTTIGNWTKAAIISTPAASSNLFIISNNQTSVIGDEIKLKNLQLIDLTMLFGAGNEPSTAAEFETWLDNNNYTSEKYNRYYEPSAAGADTVSEMFYNARVNTLNADNCKFNSEIIPDTSMFNGEGNAIADVDVYGKGDIVPVINGWNQMTKPDYARAGYAGATITGSVYKISISGTITEQPAYNNLVITQNYTFNRTHKYYLSINQVLNKNLRISGFSANIPTGSTRNIVALDGEGTWNNGFAITPVNEGDSLNITDLIINCIDITQLFGAGNEPDTVTAFETWAAANGVDLDKFYIYNEGTGPMPDMPWKLKCNNGALTYTQITRLPAGYKEVEYIENTGNGYIDTGYRGACKLYIDASLDSMATSGVLFGTSATRGSYLATLSNTNKWAIGQTSTTYSSNVRTKVYVDFAETGSTLRISAYKDGPTTAPYLENNWSVFKNTGDTVMPAYGKIYSLRMRDANDVLIRDYVPALNTNTNTYGFYDMINNTFTASAGTAFTAGELVNNYKLIGDNPETITDNVGHIAYAENLFDVSGYTGKDALAISAGKITRKTNTLIITGEENWGTYATSGTGFRAAITLDDLKIDTVTGLPSIAWCSHFKQHNITSAASGITSGEMRIVAGSNTLYLGMYGVCDNTTAAVKAWFKEQYDNGNPVIVVYLTNEDDIEYTDQLNTLTTAPISISGGFDDLTYDIIYANDGLKSASCKNWTMDGSVFSRNSLPSEFVRQMSNNTKVSNIQISDCSTNANDLSYFFADCHNARIINFYNLHYSNDVSTILGMFMNDEALDELHFKNITNNTNITDMFNVAGDGKLTVLTPDEVFYPTDMTNFLSGQENLEDYLTYININDCSVFTDAFKNCKKLHWILFNDWNKGTIDFGDCPELEPETIQYLLMNLNTLSANTRTLVLHDYDVFVNFIEKYPDSEYIITQYNITISIKN